MICKKFCYPRSRHDSPQSVESICSLDKALRAWFFTSKWLPVVNHCFGFTLRLGPTVRVPLHQKKRNPCVKMMKNVWTLKSNRAMMPPRQWNVVRNRFRSSQFLSNPMCSWVAFRFSSTPPPPLSRSHIFQSCLAWEIRPWKVPVCAKCCL